MDKLNPSTTKLPCNAIVTFNYETERKLQELKNCDNLQKAIDILQDDNAKIREIVKITDSFCGPRYHASNGRVWSNAFIVTPKKNLDFLKIFSWLGTIFSIVGAFLVANGFFLIGYLFFGAGAIFLLIMAKMIRNNALMLLEFIFLLANINGIITNL